MTYQLVFHCSVKSLGHQKPLGSALALGEGWSVGNSVGDEVGDSVGDKVGDPVGGEVGDPVGDEVSELLSKDLMRKEGPKFVSVFFWGGGEINAQGTSKKMKRHS